MNDSQNFSPIKVLLSSIGRRVELLRMLKDQAQKLDNVKLVLIGLDADDSCSACKEPDLFIKVPMNYDKRWTETIELIVREQSPDIIIPLNDNELLRWSKFKLRDWPVLTSSTLSHSLFLDKKESSIWFEKHGISTPPIIHKGNIDTFNKIVKRPRFGSRSIGLEICDRSDQRVSKWIDDNEVVMTPFIEGDEFTVDMVVETDKLDLIIVPRIRQLIRDGESIYGETVNDGAVIEIAKQVLGEAEGLYGPISLQCIKDSSGKIWVTEINTRIAGGFPLTMAAGFNFASWLAAVAKSVKVSEPLTPQWGVKMRRYLSTNFIFP